MLIRHENEPGAQPMIADRYNRVGFSHPSRSEWARERIGRAISGLITTTALVLAIAVVVVSIGIARAEVGSPGVEWIASVWRAI
jgi:hypothetical protein